MRFPNAQKLASRAVLCAAAFLGAEAPTEHARAEEVPKAIHEVQSATRKWMATNGGVFPIHVQVGERQKILHFESVQSNGGHCVVLRDGDTRYGIRIAEFDRNIGSNIHELHQTDAVGPLHIRGFLLRNNYPVSFEIPPETLTTIAKAMEGAAAQANGCLCKVPLKADTTDVGGNAFLAAKIRSGVNTRLRQADLEGKHIPNAEQRSLYEIQPTVHLQPIQSTPTPGEMPTAGIAPQK